MSHISINRLAWSLVQRFLDDPELYKIKVLASASEPTIIDTGIKAEGGYEAGRLLTEICMGGLARAEISRKNFGEMELPTVSIRTDYPILATLGSQYAGWQIKENGYFAIGSGPARSIAQKPRRIFEEIGYEDHYEKAIIVLEAESSPSLDILRRFAGECKVPVQNLVVIMAPTSSLAGTIQVSGRIVETGVHKLRLLGLTSKMITHAWGSAPIAPLHPRFENAMGRTNDAILYGGTVFFVVDCDQEMELESVLNSAPAEASEGYGKPFVEILEEADRDFYKVDPNLFAPAKFIVNNTRTGNCFIRGRINPNALAKSFGF